MAKITKSLFNLIGGGGRSLKEGPPAKNHAGFVGTARLSRIKNSMSFHSHFWFFELFSPPPNLAPPRKQVKFFARGPFIKDFPRLIFPRNAFLKRVKTLHSFAAAGDDERKLLMS